MKSMTSVLRRLCCLLAVFGVSTTLQSMSLYVYDLDSLVYMSSEIIEGDLVRTYHTEKLALADVKVSAVHAGKFKRDDSITLTALDFYTKPKAKGLGSEALESGDQLVLFLARAPSTFCYDIPTNAEIYWTAASGLRLIHGGKAVGFYQPNNPGPYVARISGVETNSSIPTVTALRGQIKESIARVERWRKLLEGTTNDSALLQLLIDRANSQDLRERDHVAELASVQLANRHDPAVLARAFAARRDYFTRDILACGFGTAAGREFLLQRMGDVGQTLTQRLDCARILGEPELLYNFITNVASGPWRPDRVNDQTNAQYLTRMAHVAVLENGYTLSMALLASLERQLNGVGDIIQAIRADAEGTLGELIRARDRVSPEARHQIDLCLIAASDQFPRLKVNPVVAILRPRNPADNYKPLPGRLTFDWSVAVNGRAPWSNVVSLVNTTTGHEWLVPTNQQFADRIRGGGSDEIPLPKDLPKGKYRVSYRFTNGSAETIGSEYFEVDLP